MEQITSALIIMVVGMGFVFSFLLLQVLATVIGAKFAQKFSYLLPEPNKAVEKAAPAAKAAAPADTEIAAVIAAALRKAGQI